MRWDERVHDLLDEGETISRRVDVGDAHVVVTNQRVLAFTPAGSGPNFQAVDRPNVDGVSRGSLVSGTFLVTVSAVAILGLLFLFLGRSLNLAGLVGGSDVDSEEIDEPAADGLLDGYDMVLTLLSVVERLLELFGILLLVGVVIYAALYWHRHGGRTLVLETAGDVDSITMPAPPDIQAHQAALEAAIFERDGATSPTQEPLDEESPSGFVSDEPP